MTEPLYALGAALLICLALWALVALPHLLRKLLAVNLLASGVFLLLLALAPPGEGSADPVAQALVLTGIVVSFAATALALALLRRWVDLSGRATLERPADDAADEDGQC